MKKLLIIVSALLLAFNVQLLGDPSAYAATTTYDDIADGEYKITAKALHADKDEASGAAGFISEDAKLTITEENVALTITIIDSDMASIEGLQIEGVEPTKDGNQWTYTLHSLQPTLKAQVQYEVPMLNMKHDVPFRFALEDLDQLPKQQEPEVDEPEEEVDQPEAGEEDEKEETKPEEQPEVTEPEENDKPETKPEEKPETSKPEEKPETDGNEEGSKEDQEEPSEEDAKEETLANGYYNVTSAYKHATEDKPSSMGRYLSEDVFVNVQDGKKEVTITVNDHKTVTKLQVNGKDSVSAKLDGNKRYETFKIDDVTAPVMAYVEYQAPFGDSIHYGTASFRIVMDIEDAQTVAAEKQPGANIAAEYVQLADGLYAIDASFINAKNGSDSAMAHYLGKQAYIDVKDGKAVMYVYIQDNETVTKVQVNGNEAVEEIKNGKETLVGFNVDPLLTELDGYAEYQAPMSNGKIHYGKADFNIALNKNTVKAVNVLPIEQEEEKEDPQPEEKPEKPEEKPETPEKVTTIDYEIKHETEDKPSEADRFFVKPAKVVKENGKTYLEVTVTGWNMIGSLKVNGKAVKVLKENKEDNTALVKFEVPNKLSTIVPMSMKVTVPGLYESTHEARLVMDASSLEESTPDEKPVEQPTEDPNEKPDPKPEVKPDEKPGKPVQKPGKEDKVSTIDYVIKHATENKASAADNFFVKPAKVVKENGKTYLEVTITSWSMVGSLQVNGKAVKVLKEDKKADTALVKFEVPNNLSTIVPLSMQVTVPGLYDTTHEARLVMDPSTFKEDGKLEKPGAPSKPGQKPTLEQPTKPSKVNPGKSTTTDADKVYKIDYIIKHATANEASAADNFFVKPGVLLEKDGKHYLQVKVNNWSMIDWLTVNGKSITVISEDRQADTATIQFEVPKDLSEIVSLSMKVTVPGLYETVHEARLVMNADSLKEVKNKEDYKIYAANGGKGSTGKKDEDPLLKPSFGMNGNGDGDVKETAAAGQSNPQTGDKSTILLYTLLLLVSSTLLFVRFRKHQVNE